jgi:polar amino acid transport system substrate-binding protein
VARLSDRAETDDRYAPFVRAARAGALAAIVVALAACLPQTSPEPSATPAPTVARPRFELATYMYALQTKSKIRIAVQDDAAPLSTRGANGSYAGFEPDLGRELARAIFGARPDIDSAIEWISVDRSTAVAALVSLQADVVIARLTVTDEHAASVDLTDPYFITGERILVTTKNDEIKDLSDLDTKTVCVQAGSGVDDHVENANELARTLTLDTYDSCLGALQRGQVDAVGADETTLWALIRKDPNTKIVAAPIEAQRYAIGIKKHTGDRQGFLPFLNTFLAGAIRDGTWGRLYAQDIAPLSKETKTAP